VTHSAVGAADEHYLKAGKHLTSPQRARVDLAQGMVPGHEAAGLVQEIEINVTSVKVGGRVSLGYIHKVCGCCENCLTGK